MFLMLHVMCSGNDVTQKLVSLVDLFGEIIGSGMKIQLLVDQM